MSLRAVGDTMKERAHVRGCMIGTLIRTGKFKGIWLMIEVPSDTLLPVLITN